MVDSQTGFQRLPLELRNQVYQYVIGDIRQLNVSSGPRLGSLSEQAGRRQLLQHLPRSLFLNQQLVNEAIKVSLQQVSGIKASSPRGIAALFPSGKPLRNIRRLEFTFAQPFYSSNGRRTCSSPQDIASRCPGLEELTLLFPATKGTMNNFASDLISIFENQKLLKLKLRYRDVPIDAGGWNPDVALFRPLESWFLRECRGRERHITITIDLSPDRVPTCYEERRIQDGNFTYIHGFDMFA
ncbi:hypothetical protein DE146DRAFT_62497 [Phaeosphaeria sp. MPI-PUGE-AT-0046c]|nr:hypothetical protein DE146DRAFT_62497 [Phaeosphaeria sp. MPI-PUGE-AT-0046c]